MSHPALATKYRPQTFAQVAGQDTLKTILSRAAAEGRVAPAYLFSGTRGVGKTTLARIFAKALNCRTAPTAEPCNQCDQCKAVTLGHSLDVVEIDGASNRGIDDVRRLKEVVGYAPMEGNYKVFIIDEAHMLSRDAFNALLKTLEEPPARVTFIMATTEPHKFPATIISRCQHFSFKRLAEASLIAHLTSVLEREGLEFDTTAVRLLARRGAGSVRDSMSLLGQVLALGPGRLTEESTRNVLGLVGQEAFGKILAAFIAGDSLALVTLAREMLDQGLDIGFFLRELGTLWRNLFVLRQSGEKALPALDLPEEEARALFAYAGDFSLGHIHASWQMTVEGQRRILSSLEPALALELLLLNLAMLPQLLSLEQLSTLGRRQAGGDSQSSGSQGTSNKGFGKAPVSSVPPASPSASQPRQTYSAVPTQQHEATEVEEDPDPASPPVFFPPPFASAVETLDASLFPSTLEGSYPDSTLVSDSEPEQALSPGLLYTKEDTRPAAYSAVGADTLLASPLDSLGSEVLQEQTTPTKADIPPSLAPPDWDAILAAGSGEGSPPWFNSLLRSLAAAWDGPTLLLTPKDIFTSQRIQEPATRALLDGLLTAQYGGLPSYRVMPPATVPKAHDMLKQEVLENPLVQKMVAELGARVLDFGQMHRQ